MPRTVQLTEAEVETLDILRIGLAGIFDDPAERLILDSLDQRGIARIRNGEWELTPWGHEIRESIRAEEDNHLW